LNLKYRPTLEELMDGQKAQPTELIEENVDALKGKVRKH
jgi:hypothetical protein